jgi:large subunit ribosomal protein L30
MSTPVDSGMVRIKLVRSINGTQGRHRLCVKALGLRKLNDEVVLVDSPSVRGLINKVRYLVTDER